MNVVDKFISKFDQNTPMRDSLRLVSDFSATYPEHIGEAARRLLLASPTFAIYFDELLCYLPISDYHELVEPALTMLTENLSHKRANSLVAHACLQAQESVYPYLDKIYDYRDIIYDSMFAWRDSGLQHFEFLHHRLWRVAQSHDERMDAIVRLFETRETKALEFGLAIYSATISSDEERAQYLLASVGYQMTNEVLQPLYVPQPLHFVFSDDYFKRSDHSDGRGSRLLRNDPTWNVPVDTNKPSYHFGGILSTSVCDSCDQPLHHLVTLDPIPENIKPIVQSVPRLIVATCLSCIGGFPMYFRHDGGKEPINIRTTADRLPNEWAIPFVQDNIHLVNAGQRWKWQEDGLSDRQNRHRVGGHPSWVQGCDYPDCPDCSKTMRFIMQLDSYLPLTNGTYWLWGDVGILYCFWCDDCSISANYYQCS